MNRIIAEFFVRALCISERKDIGRFFSEYTNERIKMGVLCENNLWLDDTKTCDESKCFLSQQLTAEQTDSGK